MRYLITGAKGQLGAEWVDFLKGQNIPFNAFGSDELDITNKKRIEEKLQTYKPDTLINCAAYTQVDKAETEEKKACLVNKNGVQNLWEVCRKKEIKLVHYSTDYVFPGRAADRKHLPDGYPETAPKKPINSYGKTKREGEKVLEIEPGNWLMIRVSWLCGRHGNNFVKTMLRLSKKRDTITVVDDQYGAPTFTFDVVQKTVNLLEKNRTGVYHISSGGIISWAEFADEIFNLSDVNCAVKPISSDEFPTDAKRPSFSKLSTKKLETEGVQTLEWKSGLGKLIKQLHS